MSTAAFILGYHIDLPLGKGTSLAGIALYILLNWSYTTAVFTNPGSTTDSQGGYNSLPTRAPPVATSFTVKSTGELRFCKKCQAQKPDRAHHCSTCRKCVLKMDHHCPWLATCVGLRNYKAFMLFLIYTTLFCFVCFGVSASWVWAEIISDGKYSDSIMPINYVMLAVISGIIGVVLAGFTGWHIMLASKGQTTIECLEKTRYLSPLRKSMQRQHIIQHQDEGDNPPSYGQQLRDIHTNALPGVTRPEEGEVHVGVKYAETRPVYPSFDAEERSRARERYENYLDEQDSEKLPNAFDLGWRKNLLHIFGSSRPLWCFPICNTIGDGWSWEPSPKWLAARDRLRVEREEQLQRERAAGWGLEPAYNDRNHISPPNEGAGRHYVTPPVRSLGRKSPSKADRILGRDPSQYADGIDLRHESAMPMQNLRPNDNDLDEDGYESSSDEHAAEQRKYNGRSTVGWSAQRIAGAASGLLRKPPNHQGKENRNWNGDNVDDGVD